jgi:mannosyltransferase
MRSSWLLAAALLLESLLLFHRLDLLPVWGDETFTLRVAPQPLARIPAMTAEDIHPPLYYLLLHAWLEVPLPGTPLARARGLSALWVLLATIAVDCFWLRRLSPPDRVRFLALWTISPCLLLYGRMARSYSMQLFVACLAVYAGCRMLEAPASRVRVALYAGAGALALYTHYVPGIAIVAAVSVVAAFRSWRGRRADLVRPILISHAAMLILYLPGSPARAMRCSSGAPAMPTRRPAASSWSRSSKWGSGPSRSSLVKRFPNGGYGWQVCCCRYC